MGWQENWRFLSFFLNLIQSFCSCNNHVVFSGLNKKKEQYESELEELGSIRDMHLKESEASGKISGLEKKIQYAEIEKVQSNMEAASLLISN